MSNFIDEVQKAWWNVDNFATHDLEKLPQELASLMNEVNLSYFIAFITILLFHQKLLHLNVVVLAKELQESKHAAECKFIVKLCLNFEFVSFMAKHLDKYVLFGIEVIIGIDDFI